MKMSCRQIIRQASGGVGWLALIGKIAAGEPQAAAPDTAEAGRDYAYRVAQAWLVLVAEADRL